VGAAKQQPKGHARRRQLARERALQALYQWLLTGDEAYDIEKQFLEEREMGGVDSEYFSALLRGATKEAATLDEALAPHVQRGVDRIDPVEHAVLLIAAFELVHRIDVPYRVVVDEAIELAKRFGGEDGHRFVNAVLDKLLPRYRSAELSATRP
jgi:N utilization substance protein B